MSPTRNGHKRVLPLQTQMWYHQQRILIVIAALGGPDALSF